MATRKIKDAKDINSGELIYFKSHAKATYMSDGRNVENIINDILSSGASVHYLDFDVADLESLLAEYVEGETTPYFEGDYYSLKDAVEKGRLIIIPKDKNNHSLGGYVVGTTVSITNGIGVVEFSMQVGQFIYFLSIGSIDLEDDDFYVVNATSVHRRSIDELVTEEYVDQKLGDVNAVLENIING